MLQRLKLLRKTLGYTQSEFAKYLGITQTAYSMIENGIRPLSDKYVRVICITFNVSEHYLLTGEGASYTLWKACTGNTGISPCNRKRAS